MVRHKLKPFKRDEKSSEMSFESREDTSSVSNVNSIDIEMSSLTDSQCTGSNNRQTVAIELEKNEMGNMQHEGTKGKCSRETIPFLKGYNCHISLPSDAPDVMRIGSISAKLNYCIENILNFSPICLYIGDTNTHCLHYHFKTTETNIDYDQATDESYLQDKYCELFCDVSNNIIKALATKYFTLSANVHSSKRDTVIFEIFLNEANFPHLENISYLSLKSFRNDVKLVMKFFYGSKLGGSDTVENFDHTDTQALYENLKSHTTPDFPVQHPHLIPKLREYQVKAVQWMLMREGKLPNKHKQSCNPLFVNIKTSDGIELSYNTFGGWFSKNPPETIEVKGGILADEMGLGKTVEVIACILNNPKKTPDILVSETELSEEMRYSDAKSIETISTVKKRYCCLCGLKKNKFQQKLVQCQKCGVQQHAECFGFTLMTPRDLYYCADCWVHSSTELVPSRGTLIICPFTISCQWEEEFKKHLQGNVLKIFVYRGLSVHKYIQPPILADNDVVLTSYDILAKELRYVDLPHGSLRNYRKPQKFYTPPTPLIAIQWWRVCLDEAQMAQSAATKTAQMALKLNAVNRWCVTGTPIQKSVKDIYGLFLFLKYDPYCSKIWWNEVLYKPYCQNMPHNLFHALTSVLWRTAKKNVLHQLNIPPQNTEVHFLKLSPIEEYFYGDLWQHCSNKFQEQVSKVEDVNVELKSFDRQTVAKMLQPVKKLRQACCHPQAVKGQFVSIQKTSISMEEVLVSLTNKAKYKAEESHRQLFAAYNGLAGIMKIKGKFDEVIDLYNTAISSAREHSEHIRTDSLQLYHAFYNLADLLQRNSSKILNEESDRKKQRLENKEHLVGNLSNVLLENGSTTYPVNIKAMCLESILAEVSKLKSSYLQNSLSMVTNAQSGLSLATKDVEDLNEKLQSRNRGPWWSDVVFLSVTMGNDETLVQKIKNDLLNAVNPEEFSIGCRFSDSSGLKFMICTLLDKLAQNRKNLLQVLNDLPCVPSQSDLNIAIDCHLRGRKEKQPRCQYCKVCDSISNYENMLFCGKEHQATKNLTDTTTNTTSKHVTWTDNEIERVFKALLSFAKTIGVEKNVIERGFLALKWFNASKKEFRALRNYWIKVADHVAAIDELEMARSTFQVVPHSEIPNTSPGRFITSGEVDTKLYSIRKEQQLYQVQFRQNLQKLVYLKNLSRLPNQGNGAQDGSPVENENICPICRQELEKRWSMLPCGHSLCNDCLHQYVAKFSNSQRGIPHLRCPNCREVTLYKDVSFIADEPEVPFASEFQVEGSFSVKITAIVRILLKIQKEEPQVKVLIFSTWKNVLTIISKALEVNGIPHILLDKKKTYQADMVKFKTETCINTLLVNTKSGCNGLNILEASHVLLVEPLLNGAQEEQAVGRIHRMGQNKKTTVHRFIVEKSIEENIYNFMSPRNGSAGSVEEGRLKLKDLLTLF